MKTKRIIAVFLTAVIVASCAKNENPENSEISENYDLITESGDGFSEPPIITTTPTTTPPATALEPSDVRPERPYGIDGDNLPFDFMFSGGSYILNLYHALKYHAEYENYTPDFTSYYDPAELGYTDYDELARKIYEVINSGEEYDNILMRKMTFSLEEYCRDFYEYVKIPDELIPETFTAGYADYTREGVREIEYDSFKTALTMAKAFVDGDAEYLSAIFQGGGLAPETLEFIPRTEYGSFILTKTEFSLEEGEFLHYFNIDIKTHPIGSHYDIFDYGGSFFPEWILRHDGFQIKQFSPSAINLNRIWWGNPQSDLVKFCHTYSAYAGLSAEYYRKSSWFWGLLYALTWLHDYTHFDEYGTGYFTADEFIELIDYVYGFKTDYAELEEQYTIFVDDDGVQRVYLTARGSSPTRAALVSEDINNFFAEIVINFYGDMGYMFLAKTVKYKLSVGDSGLGWRLDSAEVIYEDPNVDVLFVGY